MTFKSLALGRRGDMTVYLPPESHRPASLPMVLLLHGVYGSHWAWPFMGGAHRIADRLIRSGEIQPMGLVMPSDGLHGDGSGYLPLRGGGNHEAWIVEDVVGCAEECFPEFRRAKRRFIAGLSMGGFGALRLAAKYPDRFDAVAAHSPITRVEDFGLFVEESIESLQTAVEGEIDPLPLLIRQGDGLPPIRIDCGLDDHRLLESNRAFHRRLLDEGIDHTYTESPGGHDWDYWSARLPEALRFFDGNRP